MNSAISHLLKFSIWCWKERNLKIHGATRQEQSAKALERVREQIRNIYADPPHLASHYRSIHEVPLHHRLRMPIQAAEQWLSLIAHQAKVTQYNLTRLMRQHKPMEAHLRTMRREARSQAKERHAPATPRKAHRRTVQAAVRAMREKLYAPKDHRHRKRGTAKQSKGREVVPSNSAVQCGQSTLQFTRRPQPRYHPP